MICGNTATFAVETEIQQAFAEPSQCALGFFIIYVAGRSYGVRAPDASMLGCSFQQVQTRLRHRGQHYAPFAADVGALEIAAAYRHAFYAESPREYYHGLSRDTLRSIYHSRCGCLWAPDGDAAFDDSSYVLHFDLPAEARLIAFRGTDSGIDAASLSDVRIPATVFYDVLSTWLREFERDRRHRLGRQ